MHKIIVVNADVNEQWYPATDCLVCEVTDAQMQKLESGEHPSNIGVEGYPVHFLPSRGTKPLRLSDLEKAPVYTVFYGERTAWENTIQWQMEVPSPFYEVSAEVARKVRECRVQLVWSRTGFLSTPAPVDDEYSHLDTALAYLQTGGCLIKLPCDQGAVFVAAIPFEGGRP